MKEKEIKKENKKAGIKFIFIIIGCAVGGAVAGAASVFLAKRLSDVPVLFHSYMEDNAVMIEIILSIVMFAALVALAVYCIVILSKYKKRAELCINKDNGEELNRIENKISGILIITKTFLILLYLYISVEIFITVNYVSKENKAVLLYAIGILFAGMVIIMLAQQKTVDLLKTINPEKKGSVYDMKFDKKWEESCDELEKLQIYRASYKAFQTVNMTCIILWVIFTIMMLVTKTGFLAVLAVLIIWSAASFVYFYFTNKYSSKMD